jgi:hypothetical protein
MEAEMGKLIDRLEKIRDIAHQPTTDEHASVLRQRLDFIHLEALNALAGLRPLDLRQWIADERERIDLEHREALRGPESSAQHAKRLHERNGEWKILRRLEDVLNDERAEARARQQYARTHGVQDDGSSKFIP